MHVCMCVLHAGMDVCMHVCVCHECVCMGACM